MINLQVAIPLTVALATPVAVLFRWFQHRERLAALAARPTAAVEDAARLDRLEQAVEAIAVEVERVGEGQRYLTRVLADRSAPTPAPAARARTNTPH